MLEAHLVMPQNRWACWKARKLQFIYKFSIKLQIWTSVTYFVWPKNIKPHIKLIRTNTTLDLSQKAEKRYPQTNLTFIKRTAISVYVDFLFH